MTHRGVHEVTVRAWRRPGASVSPAAASAAGTGAAVDMAALRAGEALLCCVNWSRPCSVARTLCVVSERLSFVEN
jgi:hypothetical protein